MSSNFLYTTLSLYLKVIIMFTATRHVFGVLCVLLLLSGLAYTMQVRPSVAANARGVSSQMTTRADVRMDEWSHYTKITVSLVHACGLTDSGAVHCWGKNIDGQIGDGTTVNSDRPIRLTTLRSETITDVSSNDGLTTCALTSSGKIYCWGRNEDGQVGDGTTTDRNIPTEVDNPKDGTSYIWPTPVFTQISVGYSHSCAVDTLHRLFCWGLNDSFVLMYGSETSSYASPTLLAVPVTGTIARVAVGSKNTCVVTTDGAVYCWGQNTFGALGNGTFTDADWSDPQRVQLPAGSIASDVSVAYAGVCALTSVGKVYCWGGNSVGDGSTTNRNTPVLILGHETMTEVQKGRTWTCALTSTNATYCWGLGVNTLGNSGGTYESTTPVLVSNPSGETIVHVSVGTSMACLLAESGRAYCWGQNNSGLAGTCDDYSRSLPTLVGLMCTPSATETPTQTATPSSTSTASRTPSKTMTPTRSYTPSRTRTPCAALCGYALEAWGAADNAVVYATQRDLSGVTAVDAGIYHAVALRADGSVTTIGGLPHKLVTVPVGATSEVAAVAAGGLNAVLALKTDGTVLSSGGDNYGTWTSPVGLSGVTKIDASMTFAGALKSDGTVVVWPDTMDFYGVTTPPAEATSLTAFALGEAHAVALKGDGTVISWGSGVSGQTTVPTGLTGVTEVGAGNHFSIALKSDGTVVVWGSYMTGMSTSAPITVPDGTTGITKIVTGPNGALLGKEDGTWIGIGSLINYGVTVPTVPAGLNNITQMAMGNGYVLAIVGTAGPVLTSTNTPLPATNTPSVPTRTRTKTLTPTKFAIFTKTRTPTKLVEASSTPTKFIKPSATKSNITPPRNTATRVASATSVATATRTATKRLPSATKTATVKPGKPTQTKIPPRTQTKTRTPIR